MGNSSEKPLWEPPLRARKFCFPCAGISRSSVSWPARKPWGVRQSCLSSHFRRLARAVCLFLRIRDGEELRVDVGCEDVSSVSDSVLVVCSGQEGRLESAIRSSLREKIELNGGCNEEACRNFPHGNRGKSRSEIKKTARGPN